ncbi:MAG: Rieske (2Fe-2S) protein [Chloroflexota bacterium]
MKSKNMTRRQVLIGLGNLSLLGVLLTAVRGSLQFLTPPVSRTTAPVIIAGPPPAFAAGLTSLPGSPAFIGRDQAGLFALSAVCTHLGCTVARQGDELACPCHASRFSLDGSNLSGPAPRPLPHLQLTLNAAGLLEVDLSQPAAPDFRLPV